jgi:uncharacterized protein YciI
MSSSTSVGATTKKYLLKYDYIPDVLEQRAPFRESHLALAQAYIDEGRCDAGGPTGPEGVQVPTGALFVFCDSAAAVEFVKNDPYVTNCIVTNHSIEEWNVVLEKK